MIRAVFSKLPCRSSCYSTLVILEHTQGHLPALTRNLLSAASLLEKSKPEASYIDGVIAFSNDAALDTFKKSDSLQSLEGILRKVFVLKGDQNLRLPEVLAPLLVTKVMKNESFAYSTLMAASTSFGKNLTPRVAALLEIAPITDVIGFGPTGTFVRPIYAGKCLHFFFKLFLHFI